MNDDVAMATEFFYLTHFSMASAMNHVTGRKLRRSNNIYCKIENLAF